MKSSEFCQIRTIKVDERIYFVASDIAKALGHSNSSKAIKDHCRNVKKMYIPHPQSSNKTLKINCIDEYDVLRLIEFSNVATEDRKVKFINYLGMKNINIVKIRKENEFVYELEQFLKALNINDGIKQYKILNYRIDYYIPSLKIAIEYDENDHSGYSYESQELRQKIIERELKCKFIRLSDKKENAFNLGLVVKGMVA